VKPMAVRKVLILCTGNSCRSQMAEALVNHDLAGAWVAESAGTRPAAAVHPLAVAVMDEIGIDIQTQQPKTIDAVRDHPFDLVVTVCANAAAECPMWPGRAPTVHIGFDDPAEATGSPDQIRAEFRRVRDEIRHTVLDYLTHKA
jgi:arsenate reductase